MHGNFKESLQISVVYFLIEYFYEGESMRILLAVILEGIKLVPVEAIF